VRLALETLPIPPLLSGGESSSCIKVRGWKGFECRRCFEVGRFVERLWEVAEGVGRGTGGWRSRRGTVK